jgi:outer membrane protein OmpA-like peptidoglycan-associated protein
LPPIQSAGRGESDPVASNTGPNGADNPEGRQQNRRVEVLLER